MAIQTINIGNVVNDGLGDDLRTAFQKVNANFSELNSALTINAINLPGDGYDIFKEKTGTDLKFKKLAFGRYIRIDDEENVLRIRSEQPDGFRRITTNAGSIEASSSNNFGDIVVEGGLDIDVVTNSTNRIIIDNVKINNKSFTSILTTYDFGPITGDFNNAVQFAVANSNIDFGTIDLPSRFDLDCGSII